MFSESVGEFECQVLISTSTTIRFAIGPIFLEPTSFYLRKIRARSHISLRKQLLRSAGPVVGVIGFISGESW